MAATAAVVLATATSGAGALASGGGGCGRQVTDAPSDTIVIRNYCFGPTIARVRRGQTVTFINRDGFTHTVLGANGSWGSFSQLKSHGKAAYQFTSAGVYPFVCTFHPGMVGVVVVGPGAPHTATGTTTSAGPVVRVPAQPRTVDAAALQPASQFAEVPAGASDDPATGVMTVVIGAAVLSLGFAWAARSRRRRTLPA